MQNDTCEHGAEGFCMLCCREGEGKPLSKPLPKTRETGWCSFCNESYSIEHQNCGERD